MSDDVEKRVKALAAMWTTLLAVSTALLYIAGYLSLRFQLSALGVAVDLHVVDERYLFEGAHFLVYLVTGIPNLLILVLLVGAVGWLVSRLVPRRRREAISEKTRDWFADMDESRYPVVVGIVWSVLVFQFVMRRVFELRDLLLGPFPRRPELLVDLLCDGEGVLQPLYFAVLLGLVVPSVICLKAMWPRRSTLHMGLSVPLLAILIGVQLLLLPVNHGILTAGLGTPRVRDLPGEDTSSKVWRVWQAESKAIFLVERPGTPAVRRLVVLPDPEESRLEILKHDDLLKVLTGEHQCANR